MLVSIDIGNRLMHDPNVRAHLVAELISIDAFSEFGGVIAAPADAARIDHVAPVQTLRSDARPNLVVLRPPVAQFPLSVDLMERHAFSTQTFIPMDIGSTLIVVAPDLDGRPDLAGVKAFLVPEKTGISYSPGTWHIGMLAIEQSGSMAMLIYEDGTSADTEFVEIEKVTVVLR